MIPVSHAFTSWAGRLDFEALLGSLFETEDLRRWLTLEPDLGGVRDLLPGPNTPVREMVHQMTEVLLRHGLLEDHLFERLIHHFPGRRADIETAWTAWHQRLHSAPPIDRVAPRYHNVEMRILSEQLATAFESRRAMLLASRETGDVERQILALRRKLRQGPQLKPGEFLYHGRFQLGEVLGRGGFATVWLAYDRESNSLVALKVLHGQACDDGSVRERFERGARYTAQLHHPNIIRIIRTTFTSDEYHAYGMEYVRGGDLRRAFLTAELDEPRILEIFAQICDGLHYAHQHNFVHRDIKPTNILLDEHGVPRLTDFDLIKTPDSTGGTHTGAGMGTVCYSAPETWTNAGVADARSDLYSLGMTLMACLLRREIDPHVMWDPELALKAIPASPRLKELVLRTTHRSPDERPASASEVGAALRAMMSQNSEIPTSAFDAATEPYYANKETFDRRFVLYRIGALLMLFAVFAGASFAIFPRENILDPPKHLPLSVMARGTLLPDRFSIDPRGAAHPPLPPESIPFLTQPTSVDPEFQYDAARKRIEEHHGQLRVNCMAASSGPSRARLRFRVDILPDGHHSVSVFSGEKDLRRCVHDVFDFTFDDSPRGGAFEYSLTMTGSNLRPVAIDSEQFL